MRSSHDVTPSQPCLPRLGAGVRIAELGASPLRHRSRRQAGVWHAASDLRRFGKRCALDVCATVGRALCADFIPKSQGRVDPGMVGVVWHQPTYSGVFRWVAKALAYAWSGGTVIALLPVWSDAGWFHDALPFGKVTLLRGKLSFVGRNLDDCRVQSAGGEAAAGQAVGHLAGHWLVRRWHL